MDARVENPNEASIGDLFHRLIEEGRGYAGAEARLYKEILLHRIGKAKYGLAACGAALFIVNAGLVAAFVGLMLGLAELMGPVLAGIAVLLLASGLGYFLVRYGIGKLRALSGDEEEKAALTAGELKG